MKKEPIYADTLGFVGGKMGPPEFTPEISDRLLKAGVQLVQWGGPHPRAASWDALLGQVRGAAAEFKFRPDTFRLVRSRSDLRNIERDTDITHVLMTVQNPLQVGSDWNHLAALWDAGVRIMQLSYWTNEDGIYGCAFRATNDTGLTDLGRTYLKELARRGFILDLSHCGPRTALEAAREYEGPIFISHSGSHEVYDHPRNVSDDVVSAVVQKGGIVGVYIMTFMLDASDNTAAAWLRHLAYFVSNFGSDCVAIGSDAPVTGLPDPEAAKEDFPKLEAELARGEPLDPKYAGRWPMFIPDFDGVDRFSVMERFLIKRFGGSTANKILGLNAVDFYRRSLPKK